MIVHQVSIRLSGTLCKRPWLDAVGMKWSLCLRETFLLQGRVAPFYEHFVEQFKRTNETLVGIECLIFLDEEEKKARKNKKTKKKKEYARLCLQHTCLPPSSTRLWMRKEKTRRSEVAENQNSPHSSFTLFLLIFFFTLYNCIVSMGFLPWKIRVAFPGES